MFVKDPFVYDNFVRSDACRKKCGNVEFKVSTRVDLNDYPIATCGCVLEPFENRVHTPLSGCGIVNCSAFLVRQRNDRYETRVRDVIELMCPVCTVNIKQIQQIYKGMDMRMPRHIYEELRYSKQALRPVLRREHLLDMFEHLSPEEFDGEIPHDLLPRHLLIESGFNRFIDGVLEFFVDDAKALALEVCLYPAWEDKVHDILTLMNVPHARCAKSVSRVRDPKPLWYVTESACVDCRPTVSLPPVAAVDNTEDEGFSEDNILLEHDVRELQCACRRFCWKKEEKELLDRMGSFEIVEEAIDDIVDYMQFRDVHSPDRCSSPLDL